MSVQNDTIRSMRSGDDVTFGSLAVTDMTQSNYMNSYTTKESSPSTYVECQSISKTSYSRPAEIAPQEGTLINPNGV